MLDAWLDLMHGVACVGCGAPGRLLCVECSAALPRGGIGVRPTPAPPGLAPVFAAQEYAGTLRELILAHKEHAAFAAARPLGRVLAGVVSRAMTGELTSGTDTAVLLVPVPSRPEIVRRRGHDPLRRVVRATAARLRSAGHRAELVPLLRQRRRVGDQAGLDSAARAANLAGSMLVDARRAERLARSQLPVAVVVCDDVITTGATAREAQRALEERGIAVRSVAVLAATRRRRGGSLPF